MADSSIALEELVDLKMLPAWVNGPAPSERYAGVEGKEGVERKRESRETGKRPRQNDPRGPSKEKPHVGGDRRGHRDERTRRSRDARDFQRREHRPPREEEVLPKIAVQLLPRTNVLENIVAQIKENSVAYSLFALARLFLAKPERYEVRLTANDESPLFQLGKNGSISASREFLERGAFQLAQADFYKVEVTESEPIKGNFSSVARDRLSGTILGPTNHHDYQKHLRGMYERRFSQRMSFAEYQRQIEIVSDPQLVEQWKEDARKITHFTTLKEESPVTFSTAAETERHFRDKYLPDLVQNMAEVTIDGLTSRRLSDRPLYRVIENEWTSENASPSRMIQELTTRFRQTGVQVFRHRRGMLFVSPIRPKPLVLENAAASPSLKSVIEALTANPRVNRKDLADKILSNLEGEELERAKLALAANLRWLVDEGHVIEFNDGSLDLPRVKAKAAQETSASTAVTAAENSAGQAAPLVQTNSVEESQLTEVAAIDLNRPQVGPARQEPLAEACEPPLPSEIGGS